MSTRPEITQRNVAGSTTRSAMVPIGSAMAAAIVIGATSRQLHCGKARTANGGALEAEDKEALAVRLVIIHRGWSGIVAEFRPDEAAGEATFVNRGAAATLKLGQARGVALLAPAQAGIMVAEYAPNLVKKTIVGAGHCDKAQIRMMIGVLLPKAVPENDDAADALAI